MSTFIPFDRFLVESTIDRFNLLWGNEILSRKGNAVDTYYWNRAQAGGILGRQERSALFFVLDNYSDRTVVEIGCGAAQLSHLLAILGYRTLAIEIDRRRFELACAFREVAGSTSELRQGDFVEIELPAHALIVSLNMVSKEVSARHLRGIAAELDRGADVLISTTTFGCRERISEADWTEWEQRTMACRHRSLDRGLVWIQGR